MTEIVKILLKICIEKQNKAFSSQCDYFKSLVILSNIWTLISYREYRRKCARDINPRIRVSRRMRVCTVFEAEGVAGVAVPLFKENGVDSVLHEQVNLCMDRTTLYVVIQA